MMQGFGDVCLILQHASGAHADTGTRTMSPSANELLCEQLELMPLYLQCGMHLQARWATWLYQASLSLMVLAIPAADPHSAIG